MDAKVSILSTWQKADGTHSNSGLDIETDDTIRT